MTSVIKYALAALLLLASSSSFADTYGQLYWVHQSQGSTNLYSKPENACKSYLSTTYYYDHRTEYLSGPVGIPQNYIAGNNGGFIPSSGSPGERQTCYAKAKSNDIEYSGGYITLSLKNTFTDAENPIDNCPSGYVYSIATNSCVVPVSCEAGSDTFYSQLTDAQIASNQYWLINHGDCVYESSYFGTCDADTKTCYMGWTQTDIVATDQPDNADSGSLPQSGVTETDNPSNVESSSDTIVDTQPTVTNPDGSTVDSTTETTTNTNNSGTTISYGDNTITITDSDGTTTTYSSNKTVVTHPDGSITETITDNSSTTTPTTTTTTITQNPPNATSSATTGQTYSNSETTTNQYDENGNLTSSESTSSGTGESNDPGDEEKPGNCGAPGQPVCDVKLKDTSADFQSDLNKISQAQSDLAAERQKVVDELGDTNEDYGLGGIANFNVNTLVTQLLPLPTNTGCYGTVSTTIFNYAFVLDPCEDLIPLREILAWVFFVLTVFAVMNIMLGRRLF